MLDNYSTEERPPEWMWAFDELMSNHFKEISEKRRGGGGDDAPPLARNEFYD